MIDEIPEEFAGPRKLNYFAVLLTWTVCLLVVGTVLAEFYGFTLIESIAMFFAKSPERLLALAGFLSFSVFMVGAYQFLMNFVDG